MQSAHEGVGEGVNVCVNGGVNEGVGEVVNLGLNGSVYAGVLMVMCVWSVLLRACVLCGERDVCFVFCVCERRYAVAVCVVVCDCVRGCVRFRG